MPVSAARSLPATRFGSGRGGRARCDLSRRRTLDLSGALARRAPAPRRASTPGSYRTSRAWNSRTLRSPSRRCKGLRGPDAAGAGGALAQLFAALDLVELQSRLNAWLPESPRL